MYLSFKLVSVHHPDFCNEFVQVIDMLCVIGCLNIEDELRTFSFF